MLNEIDSSIYHKTEWKLQVLKLMEPFRLDDGWDMERAEKCYQQGGMDAMAVLLTAGTKGDHFFIEKRFQELVLQAAKTLPEDTVFSLDSLISPCGWLEFAEPVKGEFFDDEMKPVTMEYTTFGWITYKNQLIGINVARTPTLKDGGDVGAWRFSLGKPPNSDELRLLYSAMALMQTKISAMHKQAATKPRVEKQAKKHGTFREVNVVVLRRTYQQGEPTGKHYNTEHQFRWTVVGHWRKQPYKSVGEVRPIFISEYLKGPEDKPVRMRTNIFVARR